MSSSSQTEIETKYDVGIDQAMPDLHRVSAVVAVSAPDTAHLDATYFDTADFDLARRRITLRRRTGSGDAGWHIKLPVSADERTEVHNPLSAGGNNTRVPEDVARLVTVFSRGKALIPVAHIATRRTVVRVDTADVPEAAEICDDQVEATNLTTYTTTTWREWEVELVNGGRPLLKRIEKLLLGDGAQAASSPSKLSRALGSTAPDTVPAPTRPDKRSTSGEALSFAIASDVDGLLAADPGVREDRDDSVHAMRVATRRLRSVLKLYADVLDRARIDGIRSELSWLADILGTARDAEVMADRYRTALESLDADLHRGDVADRLIGTQRRLYELAHAEIVAQLDGDRYFALLNSLDALVTEPPFTDAADASASSATRRVLRKQCKKIRAAQRSADGDPEALHEVRKSAKKLRYAAEPAVAVLGKKAGRVAKAAKKLQTVLGDHHDAVVSQQNILLEASKAHEAGEDTFTFGVLHQREGDDGTQALTGYPAARDGLSAAARKL